MLLQSTTELSTLPSGIVNLSAQIGALGSTYRNAQPFPHVVLDNLLSTDILDSVLYEMTCLREEQWRIVESKSRERVRRMRSVRELGSAGTRLVNMLHSASFLHMLSDITGVRHLLPDPYVQGAGYAAMQPGDFFNVHSDRNVAYETGLTRRLALIVFLNKGWDAQFNGQLELWNSSGTRCEVAIDPIFNRTVIFEVALPNYHGVPQPIACPVGRCRQSFIVYYHTVGTDEKSDANPRSSIFVSDLLREHPKLLTLAREVTPPLLFRAVANLLRQLKPSARRSP